MTDTLQTSIVGFSSAAIIQLGLLPDIISVVLGIVTIVHIIIKIIKEIK
tara:strand:- start:2361 stop:2507 length:147 start_codon:yes stop_codon:yes gene_type:complete